MENPHESKRIRLKIFSEKVAAEEDAHVSIKAKRILNKEEAAIMCNNMQSWYFQGS